MLREKNAVAFSVRQTKSMKICVEVACRTNFRIYADF
jgi:hypothetical protein